MKQCLKCANAFKYTYKKCLLKKYSFSSNSLDHVNHAIGSNSVTGNFLKYF